MKSLNIDRERARLAVLGLAAAGTSVGAACLFAAGPVARLAGMPFDRRSLWALRLFGVRDLCLVAGLYQATASAKPEQVRLLTSTVACAQLGDLIVTTAMLLRGSVSRRAAVAVWLGAPLTILTAVAARQAFND